MNLSLRLFAVVFFTVVFLWTVADIVSIWEATSVSSELQIMLIRGGLIALSLVFLSFWAYEDEEFTDDLQERIVKLEREITENHQRAR